MKQIRPCPNGLRLGYNRRRPCDRQPRSLRGRPCNFVPVTLELFCVVAPRSHMQHDLSMTEVRPEQVCDVLVVGGGPAGSTLASFLREAGWNIAILEKERFPRFHIGESLLPFNMPLFERLGVMEKLQEIGVVKAGVDFTLPHEDRYASLDFSQAMRPTPLTSFQVTRSEFDQVLLDKAAGNGVHVFQNMRVTDVELSANQPARITAQDKDGERKVWTARFVVDASGRDTLLGRMLGLKQRHPTHNSAAIFSHFEGVPRRDGRDEGNISIYWFEHGWIWMIPLRNGITSIGAVSSPSYFQNRNETSAQILLDSLTLCPPAANRLGNAKMVMPATATGNYSYMCRSMHGDNYLMVGDAFAFVDPVFSSGVYLAMQSALTGSEAIDAWLRDPRRGRVLLRRHVKLVRRAIQNYTWFIRRINQPALQRLFMGPQNAPRMQAAVLSTLAGDVYGNKRLSIPLLLFKTVYLIYRMFSSKLAPITKERL